MRYQVNALVHVVSETGDVEVKAVEEALSQRGYHWSSSNTWDDDYNAYRKFEIGSRDGVGTLQDADVREVMRVIHMVSPGSFLTYVERD